MASSTCRTSRIGIGGPSVTLGMIDALIGVIVPRTNTHRRARLAGISLRLRYTEPVSESLHQPRPLSNSVNAERAHTVEHDAHHESPLPETAQRGKRNNEERPTSISIDDTDGDRELQDE